MKTENYYLSNIKENLTKCPMANGIFHASNIWVKKIEYCEWIKKHLPEDKFRTAIK